MRYAAKCDRNQPEIVATLRKMGCTVAHTHMVSKGFPDVAIGYAGQTFLAEIKDGDLPPSQRKLTPDEEVFHDTWKGHVTILESINDVIKFFQRISGRAT